MSDDSTGSQRDRLLLALACLTCALTAAPALAQQAPFAEERVLEVDVFVRSDLDLGSDAANRARVDELLRGAWQRLQDVAGPEDHACPVRLAARDVRTFTPGVDGFADIDLQTYEFPARDAGLYLAPGPGPSFALGGRAYVWVSEDWDRLRTSASWAVAHELGHTVGLHHLDVAQGAPCTLMSYGALADGCAGNRSLAPFQCEAFETAATPSGRPSACLLYDAQRAASGAHPYRPAPAGTPCSDGRGSCSAEGLCQPLPPTAPRAELRPPAAPTLLP